MYTPKFISKGVHRQMLACFPILFNQLLVGVGWGWTAPTIVKLEAIDSPLPMTEEQVSWIVSVHEVGRLCSPLVCPFIVDHIGRRYSMFLVAITTVPIWFSQIFIRDFLQLSVVRLVFGLVNGLQDVASPIYITENCSATLRKVNGGLLTIVFCVGKSLGLVLATYLTYEMTATASAVIAVCALSALYFSVETPQFSIMKGRYAEAEKNLKWLRDSDSKAEELANQLEELTEYVRKEKEKKKSLRTLLLSGENLRGLLVVSGMYLISTMTGGSAIGPYIIVIFVPTDTFTSSDLLFLLEILNFASLLITPYLNARIQMRTLMIVCYLGAALSQFCTSALMYLHNRNYEIALYPWLIFISISCYCLVRSPVGPAQYVLRGELQPLSVRSLGGSLSIMITAGSGFCSIKGFLPVAEYFGMETNFLIYAFVCLLMPVLMYCCIPQAPGKIDDERLK